MKKQILIVDDEQKVLEGLRQTLQGFRKEWDLHFAGSGEEALKIMDSNPMDILIADTGMPGMNGAQLLAESMRLHPSTIRIVLSGQADAGMISKSAGVAHQYMSKPCDAETFRSIVARAANLRATLADSSLKKIVSQMGTLPSLPANYFEISREVLSPEGSIHKVAQIISRDPGMTAKILQLVNSALFGVRRHISNAGDAAAYLGMERIQQLVMSVHAFSMFEEAGGDSFSIESFRTHSLATAAIARRIAEWEGCNKRLTDDTFTAGLLHDIGRLLIASRLPSGSAALIRQARTEGVALWKVELNKFNTTHAEIGAYLLGLWGLPDPVIEAIAYHHRPEDFAGDPISPLTFVHVADALERELNPDEGGIPSPEINVGYLSRRGLGEHLGAWRAQSKEVRKGGVS